MDNLKKEDQDRAKLVSKFRALWEIKGSKPTSREAEKSGISDRQVRKHFGGWSALQELAIPNTKLFDPDGKVLAQKYKGLARSESRKKIVSAYEEEDYLREFKEALSSQVLKPLVLDKKELKKYLDKIAQPTEVDRELIAVMSDTHFGLNVDPEEVGHKNSYGWTEACRRSAFFAQEVATYKLHHRKNTKKLHLMLLGDLIQGLIHNKAGLDNDLLIFQKNGLFHILYHTISYLQNYFEEIEVSGLAGNHDDSIYRREGNRVTGQKYDSYINDTLFALSAVFKGKVKFNIPKTLYVIVDTIGGRVLGAHGDTTFSSIGNPGSSVNMKKLTHQVETFNQGELLAGNNEIHGVILGHVHYKLHTRTQNGIDIMTNPSMSGLDTFASSLTINSSNQGQTIIESTKKYPIGDSRVVYFDSKVDKDKKLDKIVPIYDKGLVFKG